ncbi:hypothetical protein CLV98_1293 [Dyadobacter jejuensis]|uniref:Uncharacterized protein n=1 Tax=Dyadobacter jejuensis TaxID=1082580 RepID=A0A316A838_9BACT|nr:hypothetical protein [Dyadobacter jejuensis]PWJ52974.1 hypothetical protein CLV98_1293 [Dyadobacter jejuensis]
MDWHQRFKEMKDGLGYTNANLAEITGNTADSIKSSTQPNNELPRWLKLAIVIYENTKSKSETAEMLKKKTKKDVLNFIRARLAFNSYLISQLRHIDKELMKKEHQRFDMSGYETKKGTCTLHNQNILNEFADLGIYDYVSYLFIDFYKGSPTLYLKYFHEYENHVFDLSGMGTTEIIYYIFEKTIFSEKRTRRRI